MKKVINRLLTAAMAMAVFTLAAPVAKAYGPQEVTVPIAAALQNITNQTVYTNSGTSFQPFQGVPARLVLTVSTPYTNQITLGFNTANDPNGTNFSTAATSLLATFTPITNSFAGSQVLTAYLPSTNFDAVVKARLDYATSATLGATLQSLKLEWNY